ncbi:MAG TPA: VOC family protein [Stellaceae bacterium]|nr:VOC family protein [Stellaceae bacterium]
MLRPKALDHVGLVVSDMDRTLRFYSQLGLEVLRRRERGAGVTSAVLRVGIQEINLFSQTGRVVYASIGVQAVDHFCLEMDCGSIDELVAELGRAGIAIAQGPVERSDGMALFVLDPDGVRVELSVKK